MILNERINRKYKIQFFWDIILSKSKFKKFLNKIGYFLIRYEYIENNSNNIK